MESPMPCKVQRSLWRKQTPILAYPEMHASSKLTNLRESAWRRLNRKIMKIALQEKGFNASGHYKIVHKFIAMLQAMNILDAKAAVDK